MCLYGAHVAVYTYNIYVGLNIHQTKFINGSSVYIYNGKLKIYHIMHFESIKIAIWMI